MSTEMDPHSGYRSQRGGASQVINDYSYSGPFAGCISQHAHVNRQALPCLSTGKIGVS